MAKRHCDDPSSEQASKRQRSQEQLLQYNAYGYGAYGYGQQVATPYGHDESGMMQGMIAPGGGGGGGGGGSSGGAYNAHMLAISMQA
ncbi:unnamed protein product [Gongylonema pulchrum]|uniref:GRF1-interacting factor 1 n=1 Tax=Gongylonema pulchrum TaxID=637853 RepID=A0A183EPM1_9BILA|nr:unnamed protein product [Gongylonema pulchrum]